METIKITRYQSPVGEMLVGSYGDKLCICDWVVEKRRGTIDRRIQRHLNAKYEEGTSDIIERTDTGDHRVPVRGKNRFRCGEHAI